MNQNADDRNLQVLREFTLTKSSQLRIAPGMKVLEVGPSRLSEARNSPVFKLYPETFFDLRLHVENAGGEYSDFDVDPSVNPDFLGNIESRDNELPSNFFDTVVCFSILEHVQDLGAAIHNIRSALKIGGKAHFITPWDLRFHGPRPDCWRISDDGYRWLLREHFNTTEIERIEQAERPLSPIGLYVIAERLN